MKHLQYNTRNSSEHWVNFTVLIYTPTPASVYTAICVDILDLALNYTTFTLNFIVYLSGFNGSLS